MGLMKQGEIDGVPCFWMEADGPLTAGLMFGVGTSDEPFANRGFTHLIEHLSLHGVDSEVPHNGAVDLTTTMMHCRGTVEEVGAFFERLLAGLAHLPYEQLERECRVLEAEAKRGRWVGTEALHVIYGARGPGITAVPEVGLWNAASEPVEAWRRRNFVKPNAVAFFHGPAPAGISFAELEDGPRVPRRPLPNELVHEPSYMHLQISGPSVFAPHGRGVGALVCSHAAAGRVNERLRNDRGISYSVGGGAVELDRDTQLISVSADSTDEHSSEAFDLMRTELNRLAKDGPTTEEVERYIQTHERAQREPGHEMNELLQRCRFHLEGRPFVGFETAVDRIRAMSSEELASPFRDAMDRALWLVPLATRVADARLSPVPAFSEKIAEATAHSCAYSDRILRVDDTTLSLGHEDRMVSVEHGAIVGACRYTDGAWGFWGDDGFVVLVQPSDFDATAEVQRFADRLPAELVADRGRPFRTPDEQAALEPQEAPKQSLREKLRSRKAENARKRHEQQIVPVDEKLHEPEWDDHLGHPGAIAFAKSIIAADWTEAARHFDDQETEADRQPAPLDGPPGVWPRVGHSEG